MNQVSRLCMLEKALATTLAIVEARGRRAKGRVGFRYSVLAAALTKAREALRAVLDDEGVSTERPVSLLRHERLTPNTPLHPNEPGTD